MSVWLVVLCVIVSFVGGYVFGAKDYRRQLTKVLQELVERYYEQMDQCDKNGGSYWYSKGLMEASKDAKALIDPNKKK